MKGCLGFLSIIIMIAVLINFPIFTIGLAIAIWGIYEWSVNRNIGAKSKKPAIILSLGIIFLLASAATGSSDGGVDVAEEEETESTVTETEETETEEEEESSSEEAPEETREERAAEETDLEAQKVSKDETATVTSITDGDTIKVNVDGKEESIRLLLVDTPETNHPSLPVQKYGPEATEFAEETLAGEEVELEYDGPKRDKYDRLLAYIWVDGQLFNEMLLEEGLARYAYVYDPPYTHAETLKAAEQEAKQEEKGIWSIDGYVTDDGFRTEESSSSTNSSGTTPSSNPSDESSENVYYENCTEAQEAGAAPVREGDPGYGRHLDRDGDGVGCES